MTTSTRRRVVGFTLLEVLVAIAVFAVMSSLAYAGLTRMLEGRDRLEAERDRWRSAALAFVQMEDDLAQVRPRGVRNVIGAALPAFRGQPVDPRPLGEPSIEFTRGGLFVGPNATMPDLQRVAYRLKEGRLLRLTWPALDRPPVAEPLETELLANVENLTARFHAPGTGGGWHDQWPPINSTVPLPDAVELEFDLGGVGRLKRLLLVNQ
jgi:general secretion pathway protein J